MVDSQVELDRIQPTAKSPGQQSAASDIELF
jgi:hypothetical protein